MRKLSIVLLLVICTGGVMLAQEDIAPVDGGPVSPDWEVGPTMGRLSNVAQVQIPEGFIFANAADTKMLMEAMGNPVSNQELGLVMSDLDDEHWFVVFEFDPIGYVKDDEKGSFDTDAMLESIRAGTEEGNKERRRRGWSTMQILGWERTPSYNEATHNLEWAIRGRSDGQIVINHNTRVLGRRGVMVVTLVADPEAISSTLPVLATLLGGFDYTAGDSYAEFRSGDKVAKYGLTALVVGGATAVAVKSGLFKYLWKIIVVAVVVVGGVLRKVFGGSKATPADPA